MSAIVDFAELVLGAKTEGLKKGEDALDKLGDEAERTERRADKATDKIGKDFAKVGGAIAKAAVGAVAAMATFAQASHSIQQARGFQSALAETGTLIKGTAEEMDFLSQQSRILARDFGTNATQQVNAFYQAISAGADGLKGATEVLEAANKLAIGGVTDVTTGVDALTTVVNAYAKDGLRAVDASDAMFVAMRGGKTTIGELAGSLGQIVPISSAAGVSFDETAAAVAALTTQGLSTSMAVTGLRGILSAVIAPTKQAADAATELGIEFNASALEAQGLAGFLSSIIEAADGDKEALAALFGSIEALNAALSMAGGGGEAFVRLLRDMEAKTGATDAAFEKIASNFDQRWNRAVAAFSDVALILGNALLTVVVPALETAAVVVGSFTEFLTVNAEEQRRSEAATRSQAAAADILEVALKGVNLQTKDGAGLARTLAKERIAEAKSALAAAEAELQLFEATSKSKGRNRRANEIRLESNVEEQRGLLEALRAEIAKMGIELEDSPVEQLPGTVDKTKVSLDDLKKSADALDLTFSTASDFGDGLAYLSEQINILDHAQKALEQRNASTAMRQVIDEQIKALDAMGLAADESARLRDLLGSISEDDPFADQAIALAKVIDFIEIATGGLGEMNGHASAVYENLLKALNSAIGLSAQDYTGSIDAAVKSAAALAQQFEISYKYAKTLSAMQVSSTKMTFGVGGPKAGIGGQLGAGFGQTHGPLRISLPKLEIPDFETPTTGSGAGRGASPRNVLIEEGRRLTEATRSELEKFNDALTQADRLLDAGAISQETYNRHVEQLEENYRNLEFEDVLQGIETISDAFVEAAFAGKDLGDVFANVLKQMAKDALSSGLKTILTDQVTPTKSGGVFGSLFGALFGGRRAGGGDAKSGLAYEVGENGREWFVPTEDGVIMPHGKNPFEAAGVAEQAPALRDKLDIGVTMDESTGALGAFVRDGAGRVVREATPAIVGQSVRANQRAMRASKAEYRL